MKYRVGLTDSRAKRPGFRNNRRRPSNSAKIGASTFLDFGKFKRVKRYSAKNANPSKTKGGKQTPLKKKLVKSLTIFAGVGFFLACVGIVAVGLYLKNIESSLPNPDSLVNRDSALSTQIFDRKGKLLYTIHGDQNREFVKLEDIPEYTKWALLAAEDVEFYQHKGLDLIGIAKAGFDSLVLQQRARGASTISQQLVRNTILYDVLGDEAYDRSVTRKIKEILITMQIEQNFSKDEILQLYMNEIPLGGVNYGFQSAAEAYFGKDVGELTLAESALLAGLIQSPGVYSPLFGTNPELAIDRQNYVFNQMLKHKDMTGVTEEEIEAARNEKLVYRSKDIDINAPHFVFYVKQLLVDEYGIDQVERGGLKVTTSLDLSVQKIAEEEIKKGIATYGHKWGVENGAMVAMDPKNGDILAMVGSINYNSTDNPKIDGNVNVTISPRQMGSSVKPYTYLTAFHQGYGPWLETPDIKELNFGAYKLLNWDERYGGAMTARQALLQSRNIPAVYTLQLAGIDNFIETVETLGISTVTNRNDYGLSLTLGTADMKLLEHLEGYSVFANEGIKRDARAILEVKDSKGNVLQKKEDNKGKRVWDEKEIYAINWILCDLGGFGDQPLNQYYIYNGRRTYCGKTGTNNGPTDLVSMLYHKNLVVAVWAGNNDNTPSPGGWSTTIPLPIASSFMTRMAGRYKPETFTRPSGIIATSVCNDTGEIAGKDSNCKKVPSIYISGKAPKTDKREAFYVCKTEDKVPSDVEFAKEHGLAEKAILLNKELENSLQQANYERYLENAKGTKYFFEKPAQGECSLALGKGDAPAVEIVSPSNNATVNKGQNITISAIAQAKGSVTSVEFFYDNAPVVSDTVSPYSTEFTIPADAAIGDHSIKAVVTDNKGKSSSDTITVKVSNTSSVSVSMTSPTNGQSLSQAGGDFPFALTATTVGTVITNVRFVVNGSTVGTDSNNADSTWSVNWNFPGIGSYTIKAIATKDGTEFESSTISVLVTL